MPTFSTKQKEVKNNYIRITDKKDNELFFLLKSLDCISKRINAYTTLDKKSRDILTPIVLKHGAMLIEMQLFSENLYFISSLLENESNEIFSNSRFKVYVGHNIKLMIKDVHKGNIFVHQVAIPNILKNIQKKFEINIERSDYKEQINNILKKYM